jgi:hypothetical protein
MDLTSKSDIKPLPTHITYVNMSIQYHRDYEQIVHPTYKIFSGVDSVSAFVTSPPSSYEASSLSLSFLAA